MGKLIKYEFKKQLFSKVLMLCLAAGLEIWYAVGMIADNMDWVAFSLLFLGLLTMFGMFYLGIEGIATYSNDMKTKNSYMLFLTPRNSYQIVGAKLITMFLQLAGAALVFGGLIALDLFGILIRNDGIKAVLEAVQKIVAAMSGIYVGLAEILNVFLMIFIIWLFTVMVAMLSITLSTTFLANSKGKWVISVALFFAIDWIAGKLLNGILMLFPQAEKTVEIAAEQGQVAVTLVSGTESIVSLVFYSVMIVLAYLATGYMLEKKVSV